MIIKQGFFPAKEINMKLKNKHEREFYNTVKVGYRIEQRLDEVLKVFPKLTRERAEEIIAFAKEN